MKKFVSSAVVFVFLINPASSGFAKFCEEPDIDDKTIIEKVVKNGKYENSATNKEDGYNLNLATLDFFVENHQHKNLYTPLIHELVERQIIAKSNVLDASELKEAAKQNVKNALWGPFKAVHDLFCREETPITVPSFTVHDENYFREQIEELCKGTEISERKKAEMAEKMVKMQPGFINNKEKIVRSAYGEIGVGKKLLYTGGVGTLGTAAGAGAGYTVQKISEKTAKKVIEKGAEALLTNSAGHIIGFFTVAGLVLSVAGGIYQLYSEYNYATKRLLEENYGKEYTDISYTRDNVEIAQEKLKDAIKEGMWVGKNAFYSLVSNNPKCKLTPISMFREIKGLPEPDMKTRKRLANETCSALNCGKIFKKCKDHLVKKVDACVRRDPYADCPDIPSDSLSLIHI